MAASLRKISRSGILIHVSKQSPVLPCAQYHGKILVKKQKPMPRRIYEQITQPLYEDPPQYARGSCLDPNARQNQEAEEENPYEQFLIRQLRKEVEESRTYVICHGLPCIPPRYRTLMLQLRSEGIKLGHVSNKMMKSIIEDTKYANLKPLLVWNNVKMTAPDFKVKEIVKLVKKFPEFQILGGFVEDRLVSRQDIMAMSQLPDLEAQRGQLAAILNQVGGARTLALLNHHQQRLSMNLDQLQKDSQQSPGS